MRWCLGVVLSVCILTCPAWAWSHKEHIQITRLAAERLIADPQTPAEMKRWLRSAVADIGDLEAERLFFMRKRVGMHPAGADGLLYWATVPDLVAATDSRDPQRARLVAPFGVPERTLHFVDLEELNAKPDRRAYKPDLSNLPAIAQIPQDVNDPRWSNAGMLPFRVEDCYRRLVENIRQGRLNDAPGQYPRDEHAVKWAGYLAHYVADSTQPQHATVDYKSQSYFPPQAKRPDVHAEMEYRMADDEDDDHSQLREEFWPVFVKAMAEFEDPIQTRDPWLATMQMTMRSYRGLPLIGEAAAASTENGRIDTERFFRFKGEVDGEPMSVLQLKARQLAWAVSRVATMWRQAWDEAHPG